MYTPKQNGVAKRQHRYVVGTALSLLLLYANLPLNFLSYVFQTAIYLINRLPTHILDNQSPYKRLFQ